MITLELPKNQQAIIEQASQKAGMSIEQYIISRVIVDEPRTSKTLADLVANRKLNSLTGDPVELQRAMRDEWN